MATATVGRKGQSPKWDFFEYDSKKDRIECLVVDDGKMCGTILKWKKRTNLKVYLRSVHKLATETTLNLCTSL